MTPEQIFERLLVPEGYMSPTASLVVAYWIALALPLAFILLTQLAALRLRWRASRADAAGRPNCPVVEGVGEGAKRRGRGNSALAPGVVTVCGIVEPEAGSESPVRVELEQSGTRRQTKGGTQHAWTEISRKVHARPFYLRLDSGQKLRVEPGPKPQLVDALDGTTSTTMLAVYDRRLRIAELSPGERAFVHGHLDRGVDPRAEEQGYRGGGEALVLGPPPRGAMLLSSEGLGDGFRRKARARHFGGLVMVIFVGVLQLFMHPYTLRLLRGRDDRAVVTDLRVTRTSKGGKRYRVTARVASQGQALVEDSLGLGQWQLLKVGTVIPVRFVETSRGASITGHGARLQAGAAIALVWLLLPPFGLYIYLVRRAVPWYERSAFNEVE